MKKNRVLILGGGFGGIYAALEFERRREPDFDVTLVSHDNFFLFTPMLHEVAFWRQFLRIPAWWLWRTIYLLKLPRIEKKVRVAMDWTLDLFFSRDFVQYLHNRPSGAVSNPE